ncbi:MAG: hypothetical protein KDA31_08560 [Phycisphaerales bacterium]|nr:hypothetical protein [Phycisphaerales bacterium]MCB9836792.1 hypothetical protein [Phycisphaera sp.]
MRTACCFVVLGFAVLGGCAVEDNLRLTVGETVPMKALPPMMPDTREGLVGSTDSNNIPGDGPSLAGLDRSNFEGSEFRVPIDGTYHHPHNTLPIVTRDEQARQRGEFPTMETVLEQSDPSVFERWYEFIVIPAWNIVETAWLVPTLIIDGPWETTSSPSQIKGRTSPNPPMLTPGVIALTRAELDDINQANNTSGNATDE